MMDFFRRKAGGSSRSQSPAPRPGQQPPINYGPPNATSYSSSQPPPPGSYSSSQPPPGAYGGPPQPGGAPPPMGGPPPGGPHGPPPGGPMGSGMMNNSAPPPATSSWGSLPPAHQGPPGGGLPPGQQEQGMMSQSAPPMNQNDYYSAGGYQQEPMHQQPSRPPPTQHGGPGGTHLGSMSNNNNSVNNVGSSLPPNAAPMASFANFAPGDFEVDVEQQQHPQAARGVPVPARQDQSMTGGNGGTGGPPVPGGAFYDDRPSSQLGGVDQNRSRPSGPPPRRDNDVLSSNTNEEGGMVPTETEVDRIISMLPESELDGVTLLSSIEQAVLNSLEQGNYDRVEKLSAMSHRLSNAMKEAASGNPVSQQNRTAANAAGFSLHENSASQDQMDNVSFGFPDLGGDMSRGGSGPGPASSSSRGGSKSKDNANLQNAGPGDDRNMDFGDELGNIGFPDVVSDQPPSDRERRNKDRTSSSVKPGKSPKKKKKKKASFEDQDNNVGDTTFEQSQNPTVTGFPTAFEDVQGPGMTKSGPSKSSKSTTSQQEAVAQKSSSKEFPTTFFDMTSDAGTIEPLNLNNTDEERADASGSKDGGSGDKTLQPIDEEEAVVFEFPTQHHRNNHPTDGRPSSKEQGPNIGDLIDQMMDGILTRDSTATTASTRTAGGPQDKTSEGGRSTTATIAPLNAEAAAISDPTGATLAVPQTPSFGLPLQAGTALSDVAQATVPATPSAAGVVPTSGGLLGGTAGTIQPPLHAQEQPLSQFHLQQIQMQQAAQQQQQQLYPPPAASGSGSPAPSVMQLPPALLQHQSQDLLAQPPEPSTPSVNSFDLRWHPDALLHWERKEKQYKQKIEEQAKQITNEQHNVKAILSQLQFSSSQMTKTKEKYEQTIKLWQQQFYDLAEKFAELQQNHATLQKEFKENEEKATVREKTLSDTRERLFSEKAKVANMMDEVEEKRLLYDTLQRRLLDSKKSHKSAEQELRELHHILDTTKTAVVGGKVTVERGTSSSSTYRDVCSPVMADRDDELAAAEKGPANANKTVKALKRLPLPEKFCPVILDAKGMDAGGISVPPHDPAAPQHSSSSTAASSEAPQVVVSPELTATLTEHYRNLAVHGTGPVFEDPNILVSVASIEPDNITFHVLNKGNMPADVLDFELALVGSSGNRVLLAQKEAEEKSASRQYGSLSPSKRSRSPARITNSSNRPGDQMDNSYEDLSGFLKHSKPVKGVLMTAKTEPKEIQAASTSKSPSSSRNLDTTKPFWSGRQSQSVPKTVQRTGLGQLPGERHRATALRLPSIWPKNAQTCEVRLMNYNQQGIDVSEGGNSHAAGQATEQAGGKNSSSSSSSTSHPTTSAANNNTLNLLDSMLYEDAPILELWYSSGSSENLTNYFAIRFPLHAIVRKCNLRPLSLINHAAFFERWMQKEFLENEVCFVSRARKVFSKDKNGMLHFLKCCQLGDRLRALPHLQSDGEVVATNKPTSSESSRSQLPRATAASYKLLLAAVVRRATVSPEVLVQAEIVDQNVFVTVRSTQIAVSRAMSAALVDVLADEGSVNAGVAVAGQEMVIATEKQNAAAATSSSPNRRSKANQHNIQQGPIPGRQPPPSATEIKEKEEAEQLLKKKETYLFDAEKLEDAFALEPTPTLEKLTKVSEANHGQEPLPAFYNENGELENNGKSLEEIRSKFTRTRCETLLEQIKRRQRSYVIDKLTGTGGMQF
ncbi:unnamed protein product [Amoebophrya sp. A120]|nr:unnamed protein product [Amoebophrya sp. A120]|eukprot:GSA120T00007806001.1